MTESRTTELKIVDVVSLGNLNQPSCSKKPKEDKPLLKLIKHLVNFAGNEEKTILTNSQLMNILQKEFDKDVWNLPPLAIEININVLKKFLKLWPRWDAVDAIMLKSKIDTTIDIENVLNNEYENLKVYLKDILDLSREEIENTMKKINPTTAAPKESQVVLDIHCSRQQLNQLFYSYPNPAQDMTIFNNQLDKTTKIQLSLLTLSQICYWPGVSIKINAAKVFQYKRKNVFDMKHVLVNQTLCLPPDPPEISIYVHSKPKKKAKTRSEVSKDAVVNFLDHAMDLIETMESPNSSPMKYILNVMKTDVMHCPNSIDRNSKYLYYLNQKSYVRHLYKENPAQVVTDDIPQLKEKYNLALQEYISPNVSFHISTNVKMGQDRSINALFKSLLEDREQWIQFKCTMCSLEFNGLNSLINLRSHFSEVHFDEPRAMCTGCGKSYSMPELTKMKWFHKC